MKKRISFYPIIFLLLLSDVLYAQVSGISTYTNINSKTWDQILAEDTLKWKPPYTVHLPVQPVHSPDYIHLDCALNAIHRRVYQNISFADYKKTANRKLLLFSLLLMILHLFLISTWVSCLWQTTNTRWSQENIQPWDALSYRVFVQ